VMMVATRRQKCRLATREHDYFKAQQVAVEGEGALQVSYLQMHVADARASRHGVGRGRGGRGDRVHEKAGIRGVKKVYLHRLTVESKKEPGQTAGLLQKSMNFLLFKWY
jgi:hypothetical protein